MPPNTGTGTVEGEGFPALPLAAAVIALALGAAGLATTRRR
jgi:hypothetical protein